ncbi:MAG: hypothetical protein AB7E47_15310 [Desulfovibrionaceae bacterium]
MRYGVRVLVILVLCGAFWAGVAAMAHAEAGCALDMNGDGLEDAAFLAHGAQGTSVVVLAGRDAGFVAHSAPVAARPALACREGDAVWGLAPGAHEPALHGTGGGYVLLTSPDGTSVAVLLRGNGVHRVALADAAPPATDYRHVVLEASWGD